MKVFAEKIKFTVKKRIGKTHLQNRLSFEKAAFIADTVDQGIIIGADTIPTVGRRIMRKAMTSEDVRLSLKLLSQNL